MASVSRPPVGAGEIDATKLATNAVETLKIKVRNITAPKLAASLIGSDAAALPVSLNADQDDYDPAGLADVAILRITPTGTVRIGGIVGGTQGRLLLIENNSVTSTDIVRFTDDAAGSAAANRFFVLGEVRLGPRDAALFVYDNSRWKCLSPRVSTDRMEDGIITAPKLLSPIAAAHPARIAIFQWTGNGAASQDVARDFYSHLLIVSSTSGCGLVVDNIAGGAETGWTGTGTGEGLLTDANIDIQLNKLVVKGTSAGNRSAFNVSGVVYTAVALA